MSLNPLTNQHHNNFQQGAAMFIASCVQLRLELLVCDRSVSVNIITHTFVGLKCLTETKLQILCDHVDHTRFHIVEMGCQMAQLLSAHIVRPTMCVNLTPALVTNFCSHEKFYQSVFSLSLHQVPCLECFLLSQVSPYVCGTNHPMDEDLWKVLYLMDKYCRSKAPRWKTQFDRSRFSLVGKD